MLTVFKLQAFDLFSLGERIRTSAATNHDNQFAQAHFRMSLKPSSLLRMHIT
ncbi:hypothetical protein NTG1052_780012 [Candidatus Nitrotoga sp. 1052]|nr:hypothetical protein NTG1052_780012 [Candidatus Nitrotoga sp. 1052]